MSPNIKNNGGFEDCPAGTAPTYKGCGQEQQVEEGWKKGCEHQQRERQGEQTLENVEAGLTFCHPSERWEGDGSTGVLKTQMP